MDCRSLGVQARNQQALGGGAPSGGAARVDQGAAGRKEAQGNSKEMLSSQLSVNAGCVHALEVLRKLAAHEGAAALLDAAK